MRIRIDAVSFLLLCWLCPVTVSAAATGGNKRRAKPKGTNAATVENKVEHSETGYELFKKGMRLLKKENPASRRLFAEALWRDDLSNSIDFNSAVEQIITAYREVGTVWIGQALIAEVLKKANRRDEARALVQMAMTANPEYAEAHVLRAELVDHDVDLYAMIMKQMPDIKNALSYGYNDPDILRRVAALYSTALVWVREHNLIRHTIYSC